MDNYTLNENVLIKIKNALDMSEGKGNYVNETAYKSVYGPATLINNWVEKRTEGLPQTISSEPLLSENMDQFRPYCTSILNDRGNYFNQVFDSYGLGQELLMDHLGFTYYNNYATTYDLSFNHLKKGICGPFPRHYFKGQYVPETDLTKVYGNLTQWGLKERVYSSLNREECIETIPTTETLAEFVAYDRCTVKNLNDFKSFKKVKAVY